jgi:diguanylate cyclase (GGDEF)-like protein
MTNIQAVLNAILSKNIFEYLLIDKNLKVSRTSLGVIKYMDNIPQEGDDVLKYIPEFAGYEEIIQKTSHTKDFSYAFKTVHKNGYYVNISVDHYDETTALVLFQNITEVTQSQQKLLQYSNETTLLYSALQKIIDQQSTLLFLVGSQDNIEFANQKLIEYFKAKNLNELKAMDIKLYNYYNNTLESYSDLYKIINGDETHITINNDTFILQATYIEATYTLFTLSKVTNIYRRKKSLEVEIQLDKLTNIYNKTHFDQKLSEELLKNNDFALIVVDIDNFKYINDNYGHQIGDIVLQEFSVLLEQNLRDIDLLARWGGEEFLILLKDTKEDIALSRVESIRKEIESFSFTAIKQLTASFGITCKDSSDDINSLLFRADKALYEAKESGKNRAVLKKLEKLNI